MSDPEALAGFLGKWRARWPEWRIAEVFVPAPQREVAAAWFALQQELVDAAWGGDDPLPGEAKLGWWTEELQGWSRARRRHPLGVALQRLPAPWLRLAVGLPGLAASREPVGSEEEVRALLAPFADGIAGIDAVLFPQPAAIGGATAIMRLLGLQVLLRGDSAAPLDVRARVDDPGVDHAAARAWARQLLQQWPRMSAGSRPERVFSALVRTRLERFSRGAPRLQALPWSAVLRPAWRAARG